MSIKRNHKPSKPPVRKPNRMKGAVGLIQRLRNATTVAQIDKIEEVAKEYEFLAPDTARKAKRLITERRNHLVAKSNKQNQ